MTKNAAFETSFRLSQVPPKLLLVRTGNIPNRDLLKLFSANFALLIQLLERHQVIEIDRATITVHA